MTFSITRYIRKWLYNTKLRHKILYTYLLLIIVPLALYQFIASDKMSRIMINHVTYSAEQGFDQTYSFLSYRVQRIAESTNVLISNAAVTDLLLNTVDIQNINQELQNYNSLKLMLKSMQDSLDISRVLLYVPNSFIFANEGENFLPLNNSEGVPALIG
ncbi:hypothetical protein [Paenibacillus hexagrammi]|uniref:Uncharacterized protein n=1 Tax=Paenibacillus hexagrammi TaxID=2908839 RepID=A0ABY3SLI7_9BACL|nr:hypothetical protein [Paenibacillus sp. YPD9-1]UJF34919.1 hypothetical protein L0M14_07175 [Paenibacillus sp. YPD9-1]